MDGCLRSYVFDNFERTYPSIALKNNWISDYIAIFNNEKSSQIVECIANSTVIEISISEELIVYF